MIIDKAILAMTNNNIPEDHAAISEAVHEEIDAAVERDEKVADQKYLGTNRNFLQNYKLTVRTSQG